MKDIGIAIIGGTGYGAAELLRLLCFHPNTEIVSVVSSTAVGSKVTELHPHLLGFYDFTFSKEIDFEKLSSYKQKIIFLFSAKL